MVGCTEDPTSLPFIPLFSEEINCPEEFDEDQCIVWDMAIMKLETKALSPSFAFCGANLGAFLDNVPRMRVVDEVGGATSVIDWTNDDFWFNKDFFRVFSGISDSIVADYLANVMAHEGKHFISNGQASEDEAYADGDNCSGMVW